MNARVLVILGAVLGLALGWWLRPAPQMMSDEQYGDPALAQLVRDRTDARPAAVAVGVLRGGEARTASVGAPLDGTYEIGSINKGVTGMLYADAIDRGEVTPSTTLGDVFDLGDAPAADVTLEELAQHTSGLPRGIASPLGLVTAAWDVMMARYPDTERLSDVLDFLEEASTQGRGETEYSNLGFAALGHALAERAGTSYAELVRERIAQPLGLESVSVPASREELTSRSVTPRDRSGREQEPWTGVAFAPAGGIRADVEDMLTLAGALLDGTAPGARAIEPTADFEEDRIGAGWITSELDGHIVTWHNGGTGGFRTWLGLDRENDVAVVLMAATSDPVDELAIDLLAEEAGR